MIIFIYGTTAEAIKLAPIMRRLDAQNISFEQWVTFQHTDSLRKAIPELGLRAPDRTIANGYRGKPLKSPVQMVRWMCDVLWWTTTKARSIRRGLPEGSIVLVHGDTMTTVLGTLIGRRLGLPVAHVEAGLRSGDWRHPFPEELDRKIVGRLARIHYAPTDEAARNLSGRENVVVTRGNTAKDGVRDAAVKPADAEDFGLVLLHRFEFISNTALVAETLSTLDEHSPLLMKLVVDAYSRDAVESTIRELRLAKFTVTPKLEHSEFVSVLRAAKFVVTDSGGIQEEAAELGTPTLIHRKVSERSDGLGTNALLSGWSQESVADFLQRYEEYRVVDVEKGPSPSDIIVADLIRRGFGGAGAFPN